MMLPCFTSLPDALSDIFGSSIKITQSVQLSGGDINQACRLTLNDGTHIFMKANTKENLPFFKTEAAGLSAIAKTETVRTPRMLGYGTDEAKGGYSFLLLEYAQGKKQAKDYWENFAGQLAAMHRAPALEFVSGGRYGFLEDNFIGAGRQVNTASDSFAAFFRDCRLKPQIERAFRYFEKSDFKKLDWLAQHTDRILTEPEYPSLLHGDLWSGNVITGNDGKAWLTDPAVYVGHAEADLAMTELFGGFPRAFYEAYQEAAPLQPGYSERRDFYNLYHLLNHLNLFGRAYLGPVMSVVSRYAGRM